MHYLALVRHTLRVRSYPDLKAQAAKKKNRTYIVKPDASCQGRGISLTKNIDDISPSDDCIVQHYISKVCTVCRRRRRRLGKGRPEADTVPSAPFLRAALPRQRVQVRPARLRARGQLRSPPHLPAPRGAGALLHGTLPGAHLKELRLHLR